MPPQHRVCILIIHRTTLFTQAVPVCMLTGRVSVHGSDKAFSVVCFLRWRPSSPSLSCENGAHKPLCSLLLIRETFQSFLPLPVARSCRGNHKWRVNRAQGRATLDCILNQHLNVTEFLMIYRNASRLFIWICSIAWGVGGERTKLYSNLDN